MHFARKALPVLATLAFAYAAALTTVHAQAPAINEKVTFKSATLVEGDTTVNADLTVPAGAAAKAPAVVVIHSSGGYEDKTRAPYVKLLNQAGIATLELNLFGNGGRPKNTRMNLPHVYGGLIFLASHPRINPNKIGVMGFSTGGVMSMFAASNELTQEFTGGKHRFAAHLPLYPACWAHLASIEGKNAVYKQTTYQVLTGAPVHILAGEKDGYDDSDTCQKFVQALPEAARKFVNVTLYPDAYHGWDSPENHNYFDAAANKGRGGNVSHIGNADIAEKSRAFALEFFKGALGTK